MFPPRGYFRIAGFDAPAAMAADCLRWGVPAPGRPDLAAWAAFFKRRARSSGVSESVFEGSLIKVI
jgi:hypothetical protein